MVEIHADPGLLAVEHGVSQRQDRANIGDVVDRGRCMSAPIDEEGNKGNTVGRFDTYSQQKIFLKKNVGFVRL